MITLDRMQPALRSLLNLENELRSAARNALIMRSDEAKAHMQEARRHYQEVVQAIRQELLEGSSKGHSTTSTEPDRQRLGPTGPTQVKPAEPSYEGKHPNPGNIGEAPPGPMPSADPNDKAVQLKNAIEKKRVPPS